MADEEVYSIAKMLSIRDYDIKQPSLLPLEAKLKIARHLHFDYHVDNGQIRRILKLALSDINTLFPSNK